jgi:DNA-binding MarR family transcriptional regulator
LEADARPCAEAAGLDRPSIDIILMIMMLTSWAGRLHAILDPDPDPPEAANDGAAPRRPATPAPPPELLPLARRFGHLCAGLVAEAARAEGLGPWQALALRAVAAQPGLDQRGLAAALGLDRTSAGAVARQLEDQGLIDRRDDALDRRVWRLRPSPLGAEVVAALAPRLAGAEAAILAPLPPDARRQLAALLAQAVAAQPEVARPGAGRRTRRRPLGWDA